MELGLVCSGCERSLHNHQSLRTCAIATIARRDSSFAACSSFPGVLSPSSRSCCWRDSGVGAFGGAKQQHRKNSTLTLVSGIVNTINDAGYGEGFNEWSNLLEKTSRHFRRRGPTAPNSGGGGGRLPGNTQPEGRPQKSYNISPPGLGQFRPPPSAFVPPYEESEEERKNAAVQKTILVEKLRDGQGTWQERAVLVKELQKLGVTSEDLYSVTFVAIVKQLEMVVAAQVYESLVQSGTPSEVLQLFDESSMNLLYALRTLSAGQRRAAAEYVIENSLSVEEAQKLAWAIKDHERRPLGRKDGCITLSSVVHLMLLQKGFTPAPGDCLAFMYHRQAIENQDSEQRRSFVELGLKVAVTKSAKDRFSEFS